MSPPNGVHAKPVATPGRLVRSATSLKNFCEPRYARTDSRSMVIFSLEPSATRVATLRQTERHAEIMILKSRVLRRVQNLQQRGRRVAMKTSAELVDFVQHKHRVLGAGFSNSLDNVAGQSADIGAPVTADIRLIVYAAET